MKIPDQIKPLLGFAKKSGQLFTGEKAVESCIKTNKARLILIADDLPEKRKFYWIKWCEEKNIIYGMFGTKEEYGEILGTTPRGLLALTDRTMAVQIGKYLS